ncbi:MULTISPECIES: hypothetical protein [Aequorivita]|uniref:Uncharacterized protein n=1 Tax=Aequorivita iocasae TaxID=2803865 RepID=A0ABX7DRA8_9FLAO|nr:MULTISPECIES: hypothetical protein [Aequorivita]QQX75992.1 hypothetical protein JK629_11690 [Aequorivita iocasae]UCA55453.1 hypothetical protein LDL78_11745 [Aequorivita sp. F7]
MKDSIENRFSLKDIKSAFDHFLGQEKYGVRDIFNGILNSISKQLQQEGIYAFWWKNENDLLKNHLLNPDTSYYLKGPHDNSEKANHFLRVIFNKEWINNASQGTHICLYVGKSTNIKSRINGQIKYNIDPKKFNQFDPTIWKDSKSKNQLDDDHSHLWPESKNNERLTKCKYGFGKKPNTVSQLRIGLERLFNTDALELIKEHVEISFLPYPGKENAVNRFFIEEKLIASLYPILNIDVER